MTLERLEIPPPMPFSWRPVGSGEPMIPRKMGFQSPTLAGRYFLLMKIPLEVPPRRNVAGMGFGVIKLSMEYERRPEMSGLRLRNSFMLGAEPPGVHVDCRPRLMTDKITIEGLIFGHFGNDRRSPTFAFQSKPPWMKTITMLVMA